MAHGGQCTGWGGAATELPTVRNFCVCVPLVGLIELIVQTSWASQYSLIKLQCGGSTDMAGKPGSCGPGQAVPVAQAAEEAEWVHAVGGTGNVGYRAVR